MISRTNETIPNGSTIFENTICGNSVSPVKNSSCNIYYLQADNRNNPLDDVYVKLFNLAALSVVLGSTPPDAQFLIPAGQIITQYFLNKVFPGVTFPTALSVCCVTQPGTLGNNSPVNPVIVEIFYL
jgi:hypothetical protein